MGAAKMNRTRRVGTGIVGAALLLASVLGAAPGSAGAVDRSQNDAEPFVDVLVELVRRLAAGKHITGAGDDAGPSACAGDCGAGVGLAA